MFKSQARIRELSAQLDATLARAAEYLGTHGASEAEVAAVERVRAAQESGSGEAVLVALVEAGSLQQCPFGFWREVERATASIMPLHFPNIDPEVRLRYERFRSLVQRRGQEESEPPSRPRRA